GKMGRSGATPLAAFLHGTPPVHGPYSLLAYLKKIFASLSDIKALPLPPGYRKQLEDMVGQVHFWLADQDYMLDAGLWTAKEFTDSLEKNGLYVLRDERGKPLTPTDEVFYTVYKNGMSGYQYGEFKRKEVFAAGINVIEEAMVFSLLTGRAGEIVGAMVLDYARGRLYTVRAKSVILATGHTNWLSKRATGTREMAANGLAMGARAGAELHNLEIQWFHASDAAYPDSWMRLHHYPNRWPETPHQSVMMNSDGEVYMHSEDYDTSIPYTIQMKMLCQQVMKGKARWDGGGFTNYQLADPVVMKKHSYNWEFYERLGLDGCKDLMECAITWHMSAGGISANLKTMETRVPGLFIAGPVGGHQLGGVNMASYDGVVAGAQAARCSRTTNLGELDDTQVRTCEQRVDAFISQAGRGSVSPIQVKRQIRDIVWNKVMFIKDEQNLNQALAQLEAIREEAIPNMGLRTNSVRYNTDLMDALDVQDMVEVLEMVIHACLARKESRGPHFREDFPFTDNRNWLKYVVVSRDAEKVSTRLEPIRQKYVRPKSEILDYFANPFS
ncbi:MAG: hypothetical protein ACE5JL_06185, partial [Dehalococcoidia bacterium]